MSLADRIVSDAAAVFLNSDHFSETVTYYPHRFHTDAARLPRSIQAVVTRNQVATFGPDEQILTEFEVRVANNAVTGISSEELDTGGDQIQLAPRVGESVAKRSIQYLTEHDDGMLVLICR
tara:strand:+ start:274 stop:636 length:363 start_codon:yes stop_codon:yes gene_type:complete